MKNSAKYSSAKFVVVAFCYLLSACSHLNQGRAGSPEFLNKHGTLEHVANQNSGELTKLVAQLPDGSLRVDYLDSDNRLLAREDYHTDGRRSSSEHSSDGLTTTHTYFDKNGTKLGSVKFLRNEDGKISERHEYNAEGKRLVQASYRRPTGFKGSYQSSSSRALSESYLPDLAKTEVLTTWFDIDGKRVRSELTLLESEATRSRAQLRSSEDIQ